MVKVAVVGAGINGVACALKIKEKYKNFEVVLMSREFTPETTGDGSGGLWYPYLCGDTPQPLLAKWGKETYNYLQNLHQKTENRTFVRYMPMYMLHRSQGTTDRPAWASMVDGYMDLDGLQLKYLSQLYSGHYVAGHTFNTYVVRPPAIISRLQQQFLDVGGAVLTTAVSSLRDPILREFDVIVNCTGLGAREIVPDGGVYPIRGQIIMVKAPWINVVVMDNDSGHYIIPNTETCILGGTHQEHDYNTHENKVDSQFIMDGCTRMIPSLQHAEKVDTWVGLRPGRQNIRVEAQHADGKLVIHNYGHGGSGLTLFWGCGSEVLAILDTYLANNQIKVAVSKL